MVDISKEKQAALLARAKPVSGLENALLNEIGEKIINRTRQSGSNSPHTPYKASRELADLKVDEKHNSAVFIIRESRGKIRSVILGAYWNGFYNSYKPIICDDNPEREYIRISGMNVCDFAPNYREIYFIAVPKEGKAFEGKISFKR
ncbi:MAG: hypothetical protein WC475_03475 [Candidatus Paceibacterota bacterium]